MLSPVWDYLWTLAAGVSLGMFLMGLLWLGTALLLPCPRERRREYPLAPPYQSDLPEDDDVSHA